MIAPALPLGPSGASFASYLHSLARGWTSLPAAAAAHPLMGNLSSTEGSAPAALASPADPASIAQGGFQGAVTTAYRPPGRRLRASPATAAGAGTDNDDAELYVDDDDDGDGAILFSQAGTVAADAGGHSAAAAAATAAAVAAAATAATMDDAPDAEGARPPAALANAWTPLPPVPGGAEGVSTLPNCIAPPMKEEAEVSPHD